MIVENPKLLSIEEFVRMAEPDDGAMHELVRGRIVAASVPTFLHGMIVGRACALLDQFVRPRKLGRVVLRTGLITERNPDSVRGPDVAYWSADRLPLDQEPEVYPNVAADLCVEVLSPGESLARMQEKLKEYFGCGVRLVWIVDPDACTVAVHRGLDPACVLTEADTLTGEDVLPGFACRVEEIFA